jgi:hypothetical protein
MRKKITPYILPAGLYSIVIVLVFGRALFPNEGYLLFGDDIHHQYYFYREFFNNFLKQGIFPWWNPYNFAGTPFIANPIVNIWYPPTWLFVFLPLNIAYTWHIALHILWAMTGMYVLLRKISNFKFQISNLAAWVGGLVFGLSGFFAARIWAGHVDVIAAASWMPWVVGGAVSCQLSAVSWKKHCVIAAIFLALQLLAGYQTMAFFTLEVVGLLTIFICIQKRSLLPALRALLVLFIAMGLAAIQLVPEIEFVRQSIRSYSLPYSWASYGAMTWESLKQFIHPFFFGDQLTYHGPPPNFIEHAGFVGRIGLGLAVIALLFFLRRSLWVLFFAGVAVFGLWVSLGPNATIDLQNVLWKFVPIYHSLRIPPRHLVLFVFGVSALAAFGFSLIRHFLLRLKGSVLRKCIEAGIATVIVVEMVPFARHFIELRPIPESRQDQELFSILKKDTQPYRLLQNFGVWIPQRDAFDFDVAMSKRIFSATGYDPSILRSYYEYIDLANGNAPGASILTHDVQVPYLNVFSETTDFLNIKYILVPREYDSLYGVKTDRFVLLREDVSRDYRLYENKSVLPRFFFENNKEGSVVIKRYTPNEIVLSTENKTAAILMSSEVFYPGWDGFIDGKRVDVVKSNHAFRALFVPAGKHTVMYRYSPRIFWVGGLVSVGTLTTVILWIFWRKRRR